MEKLAESTVVRIVLAATVLLWFGAGPAAAAPVDVGASQTAIDAPAGDYVAQDLKDCSDKTWYECAAVNFWDGYTDVVS